MENVNAMFALITGMAISVSLALLLEKAVFTGVMRMMAPFMSGMMRRRNATFLMNLRRTLESHRA